jgi:N-acyl homoserine lactone hydrolase
MRRRLLAALFAAALLSPATAAAQGADVRLYALDCGVFDGMDADGFADDGAYKGQKRKLVVPCYLVRHPKGDLIWDTGLPTSKDKLLAQLKQLGLEPKDIEYVSVSHSHFDHIGTAGLFAAGTWIVDPDEKAFAFRDQARANAAGFAAYSALETSRQALIEQPTYDVFGDRSVIIHQTPGHTPGHTILQVNLRRAGPVLLTGDLWHIAESLAAKRVPRFNTDRAQTLKSYELTEQLAARTKARVVRQHVPEDFEAMPKFPEPMR